MSDLPGTASASGTRGIRTPRQILNARQARQRTEQESGRRQQENAAPSAEAERRRRQEEEQQRRIDLERRKSAERRAAAAGVAAQQRDSGYRTGGSTVGGRTPGSGAYGTPSTNDTSGTTPYSRPQQYSTAATQDAPTGYRAAGATSRTRGVSTTQQLAGQQPNYTASSRAQPYDQVRGQPPERSSRVERPQQTVEPVRQPLPSELGRSTFPHAFERWEQLSAHWEGITASFNRKLELYVSETGPLPPDQGVMGRQIADLSAAGANLFHAVVELQRLRASSERKFQRWFFEMDARDREASERIAELERQLENAPVNENDRRLGEMRRELQISKEEAKRAWLELGRREDLERDQQQDLREGKAVFVGGVQVLPSSVVNRGASLRQPGVGDVYSTQPGAPQAYAESYNEPSPTDTDPFTEGRQRKQPMYPTDPSSDYIPTQQPPPPTSLGPGKPPTTSPPGSAGRFYNQPQTYLHEQPQQAPIPTRSGGAFSISESDDDHPAYDEQGQPLYDSSGRPVMFRGQPGASSVGTAGGGTGIIPGPGPTASAAAYSQPGISSFMPATSSSGGGGVSGPYGGISTTSTSTDHPSTSTTAAMPPPAIPPSVLRQQRDIERERARQAQEGTIREVISSPEPSDSESGDEDPRAQDLGQAGLPHPDDEEDDYDRHQRRVARNQARYSQGGSEGGLPTGIGSSQADYEGDGFGSGQGWDEMEVGRHHHPTRLSDVMEEEEELRSRGSRGSPRV